MVNPAANRFCEGCGGQLPLACPKCGQTAAAHAQFCGACGTGLAAALGAEPPQTVTIANWGELKQATVLFADIVSSTELIAHLDPEQAMERLRPAVQTMCAAVERFDGTIVRTLGDGIMALFGAPRAQEGHALLACQAGLAIQAMFPPTVTGTSDSGLTIRVGLHTGEIVSDAPMMDLTRERGVHGLTIHIASRLQAMAEPGTIYLSGDCHRMVRSHCNSAALGSQVLRGLHEPVQVYRLVGLKPAIASQQFRGTGLTSFLGRSHEIGTLQQGLRSIEAGETRVIGIVGAPGAGKSRLCYEFGEWCRSRLIPVFEARAQLYGHATPLQPVRELLRSFFFRILPGDAADAARARILELLSEMDLQFAEDLALVCEFLAVPLGDNPPSPLQPRARRARLLEIVGRMVRHNGATISVIIIEDLHWLDDASEEFVAALVHAVTGTHTMLMLNYRPSYSAPWMGQPGFQQIALGELSAPETDELVRQLIGSRPELGAIRQRITERSGGNPFFAEELIRSLAENGALLGQSGDYLLGMSIGGPTLPATVQAVLGARIDRLADADKFMLQIGAIMGKEFPLVVLQKIAGTSPPQTEAALRRLCEAGLLLDQTAGGDRQYAFRHPLIQEVAYSTQLRARRAALHAAVASAMEGYYHDRLDEFAGMLAHHYEAAGRVQGAAHYAARAATWAGGTSSAQAIRQWHKVRQLLRDQPRSPEGDALRIMASSQIAWLGWREGLTVEQAEPFIQEALSWAREIDDSMVPLLLFAEARILGATGGPADAYVERVQQALSMLAPGKDPGRAATLNASLCQAYGWAGLFREALAANDAAMAGIPAIDDFDQRFLGYSVAHWILSLRGRILIRLGRIVEAERCLDEMLAIDQKRIDPTVRFIAHLGYVDIGWYRNDAGLAQRHAERIAEIAERHGSPYLRVFAFACAGIAKGLIRDSTGAIEDFQAGLAIMRQASVAMEYEAEMLASLADCHCRAKDFARAIATATEAIAVARQRSARLPECRALIIQVMALTGQSGGGQSGGGGNEAAGSLLRHADDLIQRSGAEIYRPMLAQARAGLTVRAG